MMDKQPSEAAKRKACELANGLVEGVRYAPVDCEAVYSALLYALALRLDFEDRVVRGYLDRWRNGTPSRDEFKAHFAPLMLPDPVDPLEEAIKVCWVADDILIAKFRAELDKRGLTIVPKENPDTK